MSEKKIIENKPHNHKFFKKLLEKPFRFKSLRDGLLGEHLTPDVDITYYRCMYPGCEFEKEVREYPNRGSK